MPSGVNSRELVKWSLIALKAVVIAAAAVSKKRDGRENDAAQVEPIAKGQFGLLLLNASGDVIVTHRFSRKAVRVGYVNKQLVQQLVIKAGADSAVLTYESPGLLIDKPADYQCVIRALFHALAEVDVRLLSRGLVDVENS